jgi:hypothetical protein
MKNLLTILTLSLMLFSCSRVKEKTKETINEGGEVIGKTATEFFEGVSEGVDKTLQCEIHLSQSLGERGLKTGKFSINNDTSGGQNNLLTLYLIFEKDFNDDISIRVSDKKGLETGRTKMKVEGKAGEAKYYDFYFDKRTYIEVKSKITIE